MTCVCTFPTKTRSLCIDILFLCTTNMTIFCHVFTGSLQRTFRSLNVIIYLGMVPSLYTRTNFTVTMWIKLRHYKFAREYLLNTFTIYQIIFVRYINFANLLKIKFSHFYLVLFSLWHVWTPEEYRSSEPVTKNYLYLYFPFNYGMIRNELRSCWECFQVLPGALTHSIFRPQKSLQHLWCDVIAINNEAKVSFTYEMLVFTGITPT